MMRLGAKVPNSGPLPAKLGIGQMAAALEDAGFESLWTSDHVVMPRSVTSTYPFSATGEITWDVDSPWYDAMVAVTLMAAATTRCEVGVAVLVLPLRHPVVFGKQVASIDSLFGGRVALGVGAGWLAEEFAALDVPFDSRGRRLEEWIGLLRECWTGSPGEFRGEHYTLPAGVVCQPTPARSTPLLVGGMSKAALRRAGTLGDGWLALQCASALDAGSLASAVRRVREFAERAGRDPATLRFVLRVTESDAAAADIAERADAIAAAGVTEIVVDNDWSDPEAAHRSVETLRAAIG
jgi:probable F420-dependent oxidoreductase